MHLYLIVKFILENVPNYYLQVCLYETWRDIYVSHDLSSTGLWEPHVLFDFQDVLKRDSSLGVIDIGANIGMYTLLAAQMGHQVV